MNRIKGRALILNLIRGFGLMRILDLVKFYYSYILTIGQKRKFKKENPDVKLPPAYYMYETFNLNCNSFYKNGKETAKWLLSYFEKYKNISNVSILDWGCGPGRIIRHLPGLVSESCSIYGSDYNRKYVNWCQQNILNITVKKNDLNPPLLFEDDFFDIIYGISIFTHLSEKMHVAWFNELVRVTKEGGIIFLTLHGELFKSKLSVAEVELFERGKLVVKANTKEGHRTFGAYHPKEFVYRLIGNNEVVEHVAGKIVEGKLQQDIWIIKKV